MWFNECWHQWKNGITLSIVLMVLSLLSNSFKSFVKCIMYNKSGQFSHLTLNQSSLSRMWNDFINDFVYLFRNAAGDNSVKIQTESQWKNTHVSHVLTVLLTIAVVLLLWDALVVVYFRRLKVSETHHLASADEWWEKVKWIWLDEWKVTSTLRKSIKCTLFQL